MYTVHMLATWNAYCVQLSWFVITNSQTLMFVLVKSVSAQD